MFSTLHFRLLCYIFTVVHVCMIAFMHVLLHACIYLCTKLCVSAYIHVQINVHTCRHTFVCILCLCRTHISNSFLRHCRHACMHAGIRVYRHAYRHTHKHAYTRTVHVKYRLFLFYCFRNVLEITLQRSKTLRVKTPREALVQLLSVLLVELWFRELIAAGLLSCLLLGGCYLKGGNICLHLQYVQKISHLPMMPMHCGLQRRWILNGCHDFPTTRG